MENGSDYTFRPGTFRRVPANIQPMEMLARTGLVLLVAAVAGLGHAAPARWTNIGPPGGGMRSLAVDPDDSRHVVVLDYAGVAHETRDRGATWTTGEVAGCGNGVGAFIRGGSYYVACYFSAQRSTDGGSSWRMFYPQPAGGTLTMHDLLPDPRSSAGALVASDSSPRVTLDGGRTWSERTYPVALQGVPPIAFDPTVQGRLVAVENSDLPPSATTAPMRQIELWESLDGAATWRMATVVYQYAQVDGCFGRGVGVDGEGTVYVISNCGAHVSRDRGLTWAFRDGRGDGPFAATTASLNVDPLHPGHVVLAGGASMNETLDSGATWSVTASPPAFDLGGQVLAFAANGDVWSATTKGLFRRESGASAWSQVTVGGLRTALPTFVVPASTDGQVLITDTQRSMDGGATWTARAEGVTTSPLPVAGRPLQFYEPAAPGSTTPYALTTDGGATWQPAGLTLLDSATGKSVGFLEPTGAQPGVIYAATFTVSDTFSPSIPGPPSMVRSDDGGRTWIPIDAGLTGTGRSIAASAADPKLVYVSTSDGVFRSTTSGAAWTKVSPEAGVVTPDGIDVATFYVFTGSAILASRDGGATFFKTTPDVLAYMASVTADPAEAGRAYLAAFNGAVYQTRDRGATWQQAAIGRDATIIGSIGPVVATGNGRLLRTIRNSVYSITVPADPFVLDTAVWWNPAESGWGLSIVQHPDNQVVAVWYHYDAQGRPRWSIVPGGSWTDARTFVGTMYVTTGPDYFAAPFDSSRVSVKHQGTATLRFSDVDTADVSFVLDDGTRFDRHVVRQRFAAQTGALDSLGDLWWNPDESGWGLAMHQEGGTVFSTWFVYDAQGNPTWLVAPNMGQLGRSSSTSDLYTTTGPPYTGPFDPSKVVTTRVGSVSIEFGQETRWLSYSASGKTGSTPIERQPF